MGPDHVQMKTETDQGWYDYGNIACILTIFIALDKRKEVSSKYFSTSSPF